MTQEAAPIPQTLTQRIAAEVRAEVARQRVTHRELGDRIGLSQPQVSKRLSGALPMDTVDLERIANALGVPVDRFLTTPTPASAA